MSPVRCDATMSEVSGRYSRLLAAIPLRHPPRTAGIQPERPVRAFSQRTAWTSVRAANMDTKKAIFVSGEDVTSTMPGRPSKIPVCAGPGGRAWAGDSSSNRSSLAFSDPSRVTRSRSSAISRSSEVPGRRA
jgi:hypothetical protein